jgi:hypothetical protein
MKIAKSFFIIVLCVLLGNCSDDIYAPYIHILDYENQLAVWDKQNMRDYRLSLSHLSNNGYTLKQQAVIIVKNGIPESSDPPEWLTSGEKSTVSDFFSFIMKEKNKISRGGYLYAYYDPEYHYPNRIIALAGKGSGARYRDSVPDWSWYIDLRPLTDKVQETWDNLNIVDYKLMLKFSDNNANSKQAIINVKNGIPESSEPPEWLTSGEKSTIPEFFSFIKDEENIDRSNFRVSYDHIYHYPSYIGTPFLDGSEAYNWRITLILPGK